MIYLPSVDLLEKMIKSTARGQYGKPIYNIEDILVESLDHEAETLNVYKSLLPLVENYSIVLEEYAREMVYTEETHLDEVNKMLRNPGELKPFNE